MSKKVGEIVKLALPELFGRHMGFEPEDLWDFHFERHGSALEDQYRVLCTVDDLCLFNRSVLFVSG